jgi:hypothetical protein
VPLCRQSQASLSGPSGLRNLARLKGQDQLSPEAERDTGLAVTLATRQPVARAVRANGQFVANEDRTWHVSSITEGKIMAVRASLDDYMRKGQV